MNRKKVVVTFMLLIILITSIFCSCNNVKSASNPTQLSKADNSIENSNDKLFFGKNGPFYLKSVKNFRYFNTGDEILSQEVRVCILSVKEIKRLDNKQTLELVIVMQHLKAGGQVHWFALETNFHVSDEKNKAGYIEQMPSEDAGNVQSLANGIMLIKYKITLTNISQTFTLSFSTYPAINWKLNIE